MTDYPITLDEFKLFFMREAGLEYQPYPSYSADEVYNTDDRVIAVVNFKPGVWVATQDEVTEAPSLNSDYWELDEEDDLDGVILDLDIERAMGEAVFKFNKGLFAEQKGKMIFLYLTMFFLVYDKQMGASGLNGNSAAGPVIHRSVGKMSVTYAESKLYSKYPSYEFLSTNDYGRKAFNLMAPYLRAGVRILFGAASGE